MYIYIKILDLWYSSDVLGTSLPSAATAAGRRRPRRAVSGIPSPQPHNLIDPPLPPSQPHTRTHTLLKKSLPLPPPSPPPPSHSVSIRAARAASLLEATRFLSTPHPRSRSRPLPFPPGSGLHPHLLRTPRLSTLRAHLHRPAPLGAQEPARPGALLVVDALRRSVLESLAALKRPALALLLAGVLLAAASAGGPHAAALAASGGRVGGSAFSSRSSSPRSYGYSVPAPRGGYTAAPFYSPSPFVSVGPALGIGFGGSGFLVTLMGFAAFLYLAGFLSDSSGATSVLTETEKTTVLKLQVGFGCCFGGYIHICTDQVPYPVHRLAENSTSAYVNCCYIAYFPCNILPDLPHHFDMLGLSHCLNRTATEAGLVVSTPDMLPRIHISDCLDVNSSFVACIF
jgi:hypothetical protein